MAEFLWAWPAFDHMRARHFYLVGADDLSGLKQAECKGGSQGGTAANHCAC